MEDDGFAESAASIFLHSPSKLQKDSNPPILSDNAEVIFSSLKSKQISEDLLIKQPAFLHTAVQSTSKIRFVLCNGIKLWTGELCHEELESNAEDLNETTNDYILTAKKALKDPSEDNLSVKIKTGSKKDAVELSWNRILEDNSAYTLGSVKLSISTESNAVATFIYNTCTFTATLQKDLKSENEERQKLSKQNTRLVAELEKCAKIKTDLEYDLLNKFVQILNEKKAKIKSLEEEIDELNKQSVIHSDKPIETKEDNTSSCKKKVVGGKRRKIIDSSLDDSDSFLSSSFLSSSPSKLRKVMPPMLRPQDVPPLQSDTSDTDDLPDTVPNATDMLDDI